MRKIYKILLALMLFIGILAVGVNVNTIVAIEDYAVRYSLDYYTASNPISDSSWSYTNSLNTAFNKLKNKGGTVEVLKDLSFSSTITLDSTTDSSKISTVYDFVLMSQNNSIVTWTGTAANAFNVGSSDLIVLGDVVIESESTNSRCFDVFYGSVYFGIEKDEACGYINDLSTFENYSEPNKAPTIRNFETQILGAAFCAGKETARVVVGSGLVEKCGATDKTGKYSHGGILYGWGDFYMFGGVFKDNKARTGGAIYMEKSTAKAVMLGGTIIENTSSEAGAAIYIKDGSLELDGGTITQNDVSSGSEAVVVNNGTLTVGDCLIYENTKNGEVDETVNFKNKDGATITYTSDLYDTTTGALKEEVIADIDIEEIKKIQAVASLTYSAYYENGTYRFTNQGEVTIRNGVGLRMGMKIPYTMSTRITSYGIEYLDRYGNTTDEKGNLYEVTGTEKYYTLADGFTKTESLSSSTLMVFYVKFNVTDYARSYTVKPYVIIGENKVYLLPKTVTVKELATAYLTMTDVEAIMNVSSSLQFLAEVE